MALTERLPKGVSSREETPTSPVALFRGHGQLLSVTLLTISVGSLFAASMAGYVLYVTVAVRPQAPLMKLVGIMAGFGLLTVVLLGVLVFARHPLIERLRQREVRESEQYYRTLFENAPMGMAIATHNGRILAHNEALARMLDYQGHEVSRLDALSIYRITTMVPRSEVLHTELIEAADSALYDAKRDGRDCNQNLRCCLAS